MTQSRIKSSPAGLVRASAFALLVGCVALQPVAEAAFAAEEGRVYTFRAGEDFEWNPAAGDYFFIVSAPRGADVDLARLRGPRDASLDHFSPREPRIGFQVHFDGTDSRGLHVRSGDGAMVLTRLDMATLSLSNPNSNIHAVGTLDRYSCHAFDVAEGFMVGAYLVEATGDEVEFRLYNNTLDVIPGPTNALSTTIGSATLGDTNTIAQACRNAAGSGQFRIWVTYPAPGVTAESRTTMPLAQGLPILAVVGAGVLVGAIMWRRRKGGRPDI